MKVVLTCGGTGGHITPAIAIADTIRENDPRAEILFIGSEKGMENRIVPSAGYALKTLDVSGLKRSLSPSNIGVLYRALCATGRAKKILRELRPDIVIGTGGYASFPTLLAATAEKIPAAAHESNAVPGLAIRRLSSRLDRVWINFAETAKELPKAKCLTVGNPLPRGFYLPLAPADDGKKRVLSFGGSLGAREINRAVLDLMKQEVKDPDICHLHATGAGEYELWKKEFEACGLSACSRMRLVPFISDMPSQMAGATLVICRAGAMSISELAAMGKAAILIPSPNVTGDHQTKNAALLQKGAGAVLLREEELPEKLTGQVLALLSDREKRHELERNIGRYFVKDSNKKIYSDILRLAIREPHT